LHRQCGPRRRTASKWRCCCFRALNEEVSKCYRGGSVISDSNCQGTDAVTIVIRPGGAPVVVIERKLFRIGLTRWFQNVSHKPTGVTANNVAAETVMQTTSKAAMISDTPFRDCASFIVLPYPLTIPRKILHRSFQGGAGLLRAGLLPQRAAGSGYEPKPQLQHLDPEL